MKFRAKRVIECNFSSANKNSLKLWHERLGHVNCNSVKKTAVKNMIKDLHINDKEEFFCEACQFGKQARKSHLNENNEEIGQQENRIKEEAERRKTEEMTHEYQKKKSEKSVIKDKKEKSSPQAPLWQGQSCGMDKMEKEASERKITKISSGKKEESAAREKKEEAATESLPPFLIEAVTDETNNCSDMMELQDRDPLVFSEKETKEKAPMSLATFSRDFSESPTPTPPLTRSGFRTRERENPQNLKEIEATAGRRMKKAKRNVDTKSRKSIEEQKKQELISSYDDNKDVPETEPHQEKSSKKKGNKHKKTEKVKNEETAVIISEAETEIKNESELKLKPKKDKTHKDKRLRLFESLGIDPYQAEALNFGKEGQRRVRQSRRIAQSTTETEYIALALEVKEAFWLKSLLQEHGIKISKINIGVDNQSATKLALPDKLNLIMM